MIDAQYEVNGKSCFKNTSLKKIEKCHYLISRDMVRINMRRLRQLVMLSSIIRYHLQTRFTANVYSKSKKQKCQPTCKRKATYYRTTGQMQKKWKKSIKK